MKIAWLTPLRKASAIGGVTARIADRLVANAEVELWTSDRGELHNTKAPVVRYTVSDPFERQLRDYQAVLYNFGDQYAFHRDIYQMSCRVPGVAVLHDFVMHHFFVAYHAAQAPDLASYFAAMEQFYGPEARIEAQTPRQPPLWESDRVVTYPLFEALLENSVGAIVHADFLADKVRAVTDMPVRRLFLPALQVPDETVPGDALEAPDGRAVLLTVGHVNPNKRVREIIEALGRHPDIAQRVIYVVAGALPTGGYQDELRATIEKFNLQDVVRFAGHQSNDDLQRWLHRADICLNLRHPVMEGGSASLADQLMFGKAVVVSNAGVYGEMPDDCVRKVEPGLEVDRLPALLRDLLDHPDVRRGYGERGRAFALAHCEPERYASELLAFVSETAGFGAMARYADCLADAMKDLGITAGMPIIDRVAHESADLFGSPVSSPWRPGKRTR